MRYRYAITNVRLNGNNTLPSAAADRPVRHAREQSWRTTWLSSSDSKDRQERPESGGRDPVHDRGGRVHDVEVLRLPDVDGAREAPDGRSTGRAPPSSARRGGRPSVRPWPRCAMSWMRTRTAANSALGIWNASAPPGATWRRALDKRRVVGTHCSAALENTTSNGASALQSSILASIHSPSGCSERRGLDHLGGVVETEIRAYGHRARRALRAVAGPAAQSMTRAGHSTTTRAAESTDGRVRSSPKRMYSPEYPGRHRSSVCRTC